MTPLPGSVTRAENWPVPETTAPLPGERIWIVGGVLSTVMGSEAVLWLPAPSVATTMSM